MPFRYESAPILVSNSAKSHFPKLVARLKRVRRSTLEGKFASKYRTTATYLEDDLANELIKIYAEKRRRAQASTIACSYVDALPCVPRLPDGDREQAYEKALDKGRCSKRRDIGGCRKHC
jgi:ABC-type microcin C transport system permease subunit YejE